MENSHLIANGANKLKNVESPVDNRNWNADGCMVDRCTNGCGNDDSSWHNGQKSRGIPGQLCSWIDIGPVFGERKRMRKKKALKNSNEATDKEIKALQLQIDNEGWM